MKGNVRTKHFLWVIAGISLLGFFLRLWVCFEFRNLPFVSDPPAGTDMATYLKFAQGVLNGKIPDHFYYQPFYYTIYLPTALFLSLGSTFGVGVTHALLGAATIWFTGMCAGRLFGRTGGIIAAAMLCLARFHIFYTPFMLLAVLQSFWVIFLLFLVLRAYDHNRWRDWAWVALGLSVTILTRGNALLFLPLILALLCWRNRLRKNVLVFIIPVFVILTYLPQLPFALRNLHHFGRWVGPSSAKDAVLALGNTPESPPGGLSYPLAYHDWMEQAGRPGEERIPVTRNIRRWIKRDPLAFVELKFRMFLLFWDRREIPNNVNFPAVAIHSTCLRLPVLLGFGLIAPMAICGLFTGRYRGKPGRLLAAGMVAVYCLSTVLFYILARFRLPVVPLLCVFGGGGGRMALERIKGLLAKKKPRPSFSRLTIGLASGSVIVWLLYPVYTMRWGPALLRVARPSGTSVSLSEWGVARDHLPFFPFGWPGVKLNDRFMNVTKTLVLVSDTNVGNPHMEGGAEVAFFVSPGSEVEFKCTAPSGAVQISNLTFPADGYPPLQWVPVPYIPDLAERTARISFEVRKIKGDVSLAVDRQVNYGRTLLGETKENLTPLQGEAVCRLFIPQNNPRMK